MAAVSDLVTRTQISLLDLEGVSASRRQIIAQMQLELARLGREQRYGDIVLLRAIAGQSRYLLPDGLVAISQVLYNGQRLDFASEEMLDRRYATWEITDTTEPRYWTWHDESPNTVRIVPAPRRTGSNLPVQPPMPFIMPLEENLCVFYWRDFSDQANEEVDTVPLLQVWEDPLVFRTVAQVASRESPYQNLPVATIFGQLAELWLAAIEKR